jgi:predicted adenylyl cyclase CyaB
MKKHMRNIEIEVRSFINRNEYKKLEKILRKEAKFIDSIKEETVYFGAPNKDLRIRKDKKQAYIILKKGKIHDDSREEIEIRFKRDDFWKIEKLFKRLGYKDKIRWFRKRKIFKMRDIKVFLDDTTGYGLILELEKIGTVRNKERVHKYLEQKMKHLGIEITPRKVFEKKFKYYKNNWRKILNYKKI